MDQSVLSLNRKFDKPYEFWYYIISCLTSQLDKSLTEKEKELLCHAILYGENYPFFGKSRRHLMKTLSLANQTITMHKKSIMDKNFITKDGKLSPVIIKIRDKKVIAINFNFEMQE